MNGIPALAQAVQSQGRGKDTQLVHMTPNEVAGLESLAMAYGGSLTTNPRTGLKEAGFLDNILPVVAGAGLNMVFPGLGAALGGFATPAIVGGATALATKDFSKGLTAGLGAYGGSKLAGALDLTGRASVPGMSYDPNFTGDTGLLSRLTGGSTPSLSSMRGPASFAPGGTGGSLLSRAGDFIMSPITAIGEGISSLTGSVGRGQFMDAIGGVPGLLKVGIPLAGAVMGGSSLFGGDDDGGGGVESPNLTVRPYTYDPGRQTGQPGFQYRTGVPGESTAEQTYFTPSYTALTPYEIGSGSQAELEDQSRRMGNTGMAAGSQGPVRMLRGGGDATSDSMDGMIDGKEPVRLATGEVVIDGRAVSEIGNGDNEAGAKKIEAAIERIHRIRQKAKRGKPSSADKTFASMIA